MWVRNVERQTLNKTINSQNIQSGAGRRLVKISFEMRRKNEKLRNSTAAVKILTFFQLLLLNEGSIHQLGFV